MANFDPLVDTDPNDNPPEGLNPLDPFGPDPEDEPLTDTLKGGPRAPLEPDPSFEDFVDPVVPVRRNENAYRGVAAGPADHPRTAR
jgi:hypothetical protein